MMTTTTHKTEALAIEAAKQQARDEAAYSDVGIGEAVVLTDDGDTLVVQVVSGKMSEVRRAGWETTGHVNVSVEIADMVY